jgi:hypothetical protein
MNDQYKAQNDVRVLSLEASVRATNISILDVIQSIRSMALADLAEMQGNRAETLKHHQDVIDQLKIAGDRVAQSNTILDRLRNED